VRCACDTLFELEGNEAKQYARDHLVEIEADAVNWTARYRCPDTGRLWLRDYPQSELHGGGPTRLRQVDADGHPVTRPSKDPYR